MRDGPLWKRFHLSLGGQAGDCHSFRLGDLHEVSNLPEECPGCVCARAFDGGGRPDSGIGMFAGLCERRTQIKTSEGCIPRITELVRIAIVVGGVNQDWQALTIFLGRLVEHLP